jgi:hypothetical protein
MGEAMKRVEANVSWPLSRLVEEEAKRVLSETQLTADPVLIAEGWERRFVTDGRRAAEAVELYEELGYEVRAETVRREELENECEDCQLVLLMQFRTIYTRRKDRSRNE